MFSVDEYMNCSQSSVSGSSGSCSIPNKAVHEWFTFGVRGEYDISVL